LKLVIIAAVAKNNVIGKNGKMPWHSGEELAFFKGTTTGFPVIMGRSTFESIGLPLKDRLNLIITSHPELFVKFEGVKCFYNLSETLNFCMENNFSKVFIAGGGKVYSDSINLADELIISRMDLEPEGDTFFPGINPDIWLETDIIKKTDFEIHTYKRKLNDR